MSEVQSLVRRGTRPSGPGRGMPTDESRRTRKSFSEDLGRAMKDERETAAAMRQLTPIQRDIYQFIRQRTVSPGVGPSLRTILATFPGSRGHWLIGQLRAIEQLKLIGPGSWSTGLNTRDRWPG